MLLELPKIARVSKDRAERATSELERVLGPSKVMTGSACEPYARDDSPFIASSPDAVVIAESERDIVETLRIAQEHDVPVTPRAAGSGRVGGAVPMAGGIVLATHAMKRVHEIDPRDRVAVVEPGVITAELHALCEKEGVYYPPDPSSADISAIGGNVAANAGGPRAFKYGTTRDYVLGLDAVLMGGRTIRAGKRTPKGVTGYDVTGLFVGSEGTLGVITRVTLKLIAKPREIGTALALYSDVEAAATAVSSIVAAQITPRCMELLDATTLDAVRAAGISIDPRAGAMLLLEVDGDEADAQLERLGEVVSSTNGLVSIVAAQDESQRSRLWAARKTMSLAVRKLSKHKLSEDIVVPRTKIPELLARAREIGEREKVRQLAYGHAGDGNLHVNFLWNDEAEEPAVGRAIEGLMRATVALGGTLSGEHGIGIAKAPYLPLEQSAELIALQKDLKRVFDPKGLLNPGKIFAAGGHGSC